MAKKEPEKTDAQLFAELTDDDIGDVLMEPEVEEAPEVEADAEAPEPEKTEAEPKDEAPDEAPEAEAKTEEPAEELEPEPEPENEAEAPAQVPSFRLKEEADKRRAAEAELQGLRSELDQIKGFLTAQQQAQQRQAEPEEAPDIWTEPDKVLANMQAEFDRKIQNLSVQNSIAVARMTPGGEDAINAAWSHLQETNDQATAAAIMQSPDVGQSLIQYGKRVQVLSEVGDDPTAFKDKVKQELLSDPAFRAQIIAEERGQAPSTNAQGVPNVTLAPSVNTATAAGESKDATPRGERAMTDRELFSTFKSPLDNEI